MVRFLFSSRSALENLPGVLRSKTARGAFWGHRLPACSFWQPAENLPHAVTSFVVAQCHRQAADDDRLAACAPQNRVCAPQQNFPLLNCNARDYGLIQWPSRIKRVRVMSRTSTSSNSELLRAHCAAIAEEEAVLREGGGKAGHERQRKMNRLPVRERLSRLLDKESPFFEIGLW